MTFKLQGKNQVALCSFHSLTTTREAPFPPLTLGLLLPDSVQPEQLLLRLGEFDLERSDEPYAFAERKVQIIATHPQFDARTFEYDLALLRCVNLAPLPRSFS